MVTDMSKDRSAGVECQKTIAFRSCVGFYLGKSGLTDIHSYYRSYYLYLKSSIFLLRTAVPYTYCKTRYNFWICRKVVKFKLVLYNDNGPNLLNRTENKGTIFLISNFRRVLNVLFFLLRDPRRRNFICPRFRTLCLFHLHRQCKQDESAYTAYADGTYRVFRNVGI
jgi:hypothetical protein